MQAKGGPPRHLFAGAGDFAPYSLLVHGKSNVDSANDVVQQASKDRAVALNSLLILALHTMTLEDQDATSSLQPFFLFFEFFRVRYHPPEAMGKLGTTSRSAGPIINAERILVEP